MEVKGIPLVLPLMKCIHYLKGWTLRVQKKRKMLALSKTIKNFKGKIETDCYTLLGLAGSQDTDEETGDGAEHQVPH